jgi:hypothetical protein
MKYQLRRVGLRADLHYYPRTWLRIKTGAEVTNHRDNVLAQVNWRTFVNVPDSVDIVSRAAKGGAYWQGRIKAQEWMELSAGLRYDYATLYNQAVWNPRAKLILSRPPSSLLVSSGLFSQFPDVLTLIGRGEPSISPTNRQPRSRKQHSQYRRGAVEPFPAQRVKVEVYRKTFANLLLSIDERAMCRTTSRGLCRGHRISLERTRPGNERLVFGSITPWPAPAIAAAVSATDFFDYDHVSSSMPHRPALDQTMDPDPDQSLWHRLSLYTDSRHAARYLRQQRIFHRLDHGARQKEFRPLPRLLAIRRPAQLETLIGRHRLAAYIEVINLFNHANIYLYEWIPCRSSGRGYAARSVIYMMPLALFRTPLEFLKKKCTHRTSSRLQRALFVIWKAQKPG